MILMQLQRGHGAFEFNDKLPNHASKPMKEDLVSKKFAWFPKSVYFSEYSPQRVLVWLNFYYSVSRVYFARTDYEKLSSFNSKRIECLNRFLPHPHKRILSLHNAIEALSYYQRNKAKVSKMVKDTTCLEIEVPAPRTAFSDWSSANWKYLSIQSNNLLDKLFQKKHVELVPFVDEINY